MLLGWHYMYYYSNAYAMNEYLANRGYIVLAINYRSGIGYGRAFRGSAGRAGRGASEYQDVVAAGKYLQRRDDVDAKHIALWGQLRRVSDRVGPGPQFRSLCRRFRFSRRS